LQNTACTNFATEKVSVLASPGKGINEEVGIRMFSLSQMTKVKLVCALAWRENFAKCNNSVTDTKRRMPSVRDKRVSPHTIRHTTATHLLQAGVDINTIRAWLGHVSVETTNIYAEVNLEMKAKALLNCEMKAKKSKKHWRDDKNLMAFLDSL
jgi:hypothetical protein